MLLRRCQVLVGHCRAGPVGTSFEIQNAAGHSHVSCTFAVRHGDCDLICTPCWRVPGLTVVHNLGSSSVIRCSPCAARKAVKGVNGESRRAMLAARPYENLERGLDCRSPGGVLVVSASRGLLGDDRSRWWTGSGTTTSDQVRNTVYSYGRGCAACFGGTWPPPRCSARAVVGTSSTCRRRPWACIASGDSPNATARVVEFGNTLRRRAAPGDCGVDAGGEGCGVPSARW
jgi:hypothetical protein